MNLLGWFILNFSILGIILSNLAIAQTQGCDEGVIRLPDRNGTIQICSALAAKVPQLSKQMSDVSKLMGNQQKQIEDLTRLVKGLNSISRDLSSQRQEQLLINLTKELSRSSGRGESINKRDFETTIDRVEELNGMISKVSKTPNGTKEISRAMAQELGASISNLEFNSAASQIDEIQSRLKVIESGVKDIQQDTTVIRQDLSRLQTQSIEALKNISNEIRALGNQGGIVAAPKTYAEIYHNARILAQRGEFDQAVMLYQKLFDFNIQMADPIADLVTLSRRLYGVKGARNYFDQRLKEKMPKASYLYAQLLMIDPGRESEFRQIDFANDEEWLAASEQFPPLAYQQLKVDNPQKLYYQKQSWSSWKFYFELYKIVDNSIAKGDFLAFYVDQIRGGNQIDTYSQMGMAPFFEDLFLFVLSNSAMPMYQHEFDIAAKSNAADKLIGEYRLVDIEKSPIIIDYTYFNEGPVFWSFRTDAYFTWMRYSGAPKRENGLIRLSIWDPHIDKKSPIQMCSKNDKGGEYCINLIDDDKNCNKKVPGMHAYSERYKCFTVFGDVMKNMFYSMPNGDTTFLPVEWLKSECISRISYTNGLGQKVNFLAKDFVATYRWPKGRSGNDDLSQKIQSCGYQNQSTKVARKGSRPFKNSF
jgi:tetratricopeptide (TPR) repeat protein